MEIITGRFENIAAGDPEAAAARVREGRAAMLALIRERLDDPGIAPYLAPPVETRPRRVARAPGVVRSGRGAVAAGVPGEGD